MLGRDDQDPLFLQAKEAQESVLERFVGKSQYANSGQRVVAGQRLMQAASDIFLGWHRLTGLDGQARDFYIRQLRDWKGSADVDTMGASVMTLYGRICAATLARAHARSGDRIAIASYLGNSDAFDRAIAHFSSAYADQNERDYQALVQAVGLWPGRCTNRPVTTGANQWSRRASVHSSDVPSAAVRSRSRSGLNVLDPRRSGTACIVPERAEPRPSPSSRWPARPARWTPIRTISAARIAQSTARSSSSSTNNGRGATTATPDTAWRV